MLQVLPYRSHAPNSDCLLTSVAFFNSLAQVSLRTSRSLPAAQVKLLQCVAGSLMRADVRR